MTIDEISTALQEWRGDDEDKSYLLVAVDDESMTATVRNRGLLLGGALALAMEEQEETERAVELAVYLNEMGIYKDQGNDKARTEQD